MDTTFYPSVESPASRAWPADALTRHASPAERGRREPRLAFWLQIDGFEVGARVPNLDTLRRRGTWSLGALLESGVGGGQALSLADPFSLLFQAARSAGRQTALVTGRRRPRRWMAPEYLDHFS